MLIEIHQLRYFVAVAEEASFTRAAARVHVAQPGVSAQVRGLEAELGQQLLDRSGRSSRRTSSWRRARCRWWRSWPSAASAWPSCPHRLHLPHLENLLHLLHLEHLEHLENLEHLEHLEHLAERCTR